MRDLSRVAIVAVLLMVTAACDVRLGTDHHATSCTPPTLSAVGRHTRHGRIPIRPGQTLRVHGSHYTDACVPGGSGRTIARLHLVLQSTYHVGPIATVRPRGPQAAFSTSVTIPQGTRPGRAKIFDTMGSDAGVLLVVRP